MKKIIFSFRPIVYSLVSSFIFSITVAHAEPTTCSKNGVLITLDKHAVDTYNLGSPPCIEKLTFSQYLSIFLDQVGYIILFIAIIMIVGSGVQYMLSGITPDGAKQAKSRITGILSGVVLFYLVKLITHQISSGVSLK